MRFFLFALMVSACWQFAQAEPSPPVEGDVPSLDDLAPIPDEAPQALDDAQQEFQTSSEVDTLFRDLAAAKDDEQAQAIAYKIQMIWLHSGSDTIDLLMARANAAMRAGDYAVALDLMDVVTRLKPGYAEAWNRRATIDYLREDFGGAIRDIERALALEPRHWGALAGLGVVQRRIERKEDALASFKRALEINPGLDKVREAVKALEKEDEGQQL